MVLHARDMVEKDLLVLDKDTTVFEAARAMKERRLGFAVTGSANAPEGIVTEWDILEKVVASASDPRKVALREIMSSDIQSVDAEMGIAAVAKIMTEKGVRRLLVTENGHAVGVITAKAVLARLDEYVDKISSQISMLQAPWF